MGVYNPPDPPPHTGNPITDVSVAFGWMQEFFNLRAGIMRVIAEVIKAGASRVP